MRTPDPLSSLLQSWKPAIRPDPHFNAGVWGKLEQSRTDPAVVTVFPSGGLSRWSLPLAASVALLLSGALGTGTALALGSGARLERMAQAYARTIDPLQRASLEEHHHHHP